jgi:hypothetical protein
LVVTVKVLALPLPDDAWANAATVLVLTLISGVAGLWLTSTVQTEAPVTVTVPVRVWSPLRLGSVGHTVTVLLMPAGCDTPAAGEPENPVGYVTVQGVFEFTVNVRLVEEESPEAAAANAARDEALTLVLVGS